MKKAIPAAKIGVRMKVTRLVPRHLANAFADGSRHHPSSKLLVAQSIPEMQIVIKIIRSNACADRPRISKASISAKPKHQSEERTAGGPQWRLIAFGKGI